MRLTYQENRRLVKIGNLANATGMFSSKFMGLTPSEAVKDARITATAARSVNDFVTITNAGAGYTDGVYTLVFSGGGGNSAAGTVTVSDGVVRRVNITNGGADYTSAPTLSFVGAGSPSTAAILTAAIGYRIASVTVTDGGSGYITDGSTPLVGYATAHYLP